jgi:hypothetical protein
MSYETIVEDADGKRLLVGSRVRCGDDLGVVTAISDPDGDVDDYGRSVGINPKVSVDFDDGSEDSFTTFMHIRGWVDYMREDLPFRCEDVELI